MFLKKNKTPVLITQQIIKLHNFIQNLEAVSGSKRENMLLDFARKELAIEIENQELIISKRKSS